MADHKELLSTMRSRLKLAIDAYSESRNDELDDLRFMAGSPDNRWQWPQEVLLTRGAAQNSTVNARPCLTINKLPQHVRQVTNDQRQNRPSGKVIPADDKADIEVAEIFDGMVRHIEYASDADVAYDTACENQVTYGEGYIRILTEYCDPDSFDQDIRIARIRNAFSVYMDPLIQDPCGSDAKWCLITEDIAKSDYEHQYPDAMPTNSLEQAGIGDSEVSAWLTNETVRIAEYFWVEQEKRKLLLYPGNRTVFAGTPEDKALRAMGLVPLRERMSEVPRVRWIKTNGFEVLEEREWAGKWIPVVRVVGNEFFVDGRLYVSGLVRNAKDAQRMYNYWVSQETEMLALAPKAPFIGYSGQFEGYEQQWKLANVNNYPYLEVNAEAMDGQGNPLPLPQRAAPPLPQAGLIQAKMGASDDIKATTGQYDSALGAEANEKSGRAILARERQADTGTFHYVDNLARAVRYVTRQIVDLIPKIYDTERVARIIGLEGDPEMVKINPTQPEPVKKIVDPQTNAVVEKIYNPSVGKYDVRVTTGPSYMTKRQEAAQSMADLLQGNPNLWPMVGDLFVRNMDWPGAEEIAERLRKVMDPKLLEQGEETSPELAAAQQQMQQMAQAMEQMQSMLQNVQNSIEERELRVKEYDAETKRLSAVQSGMTADQVQEVVLGTIHGMLTTGDLVGEVPGGAMPVEAPQMMPEQVPEGMPMGMAQ